MRLDQATFDRLRQEQPIAGDVLRSSDGSPVRVTVRTKEEGAERKRIVFCRVKIDSSLSKWVLHDGSAGIVCMILPGSQSQLQSDDTGSLQVRSLRVCRYTRSNKAILCEVEEP